MTPSEMRVMLEAVPLFEGPKPWELVRNPIDGSGPTPDGTIGYEMVGNAIGHAFLVLLDEDPDLPLRIEKQRLIDRLWAGLKLRWPDADSWCGGATGFQVGWAVNAALYAHGSKLQVPNPAIVEIDVDGES
jgi:hypothetical protein